MSKPEQQATWWGSYQLGLDESAQWVIGSLRFWLHRSPAEWRLAYEWLDGEAAEAWSVRRGVEPPEDGVQTERFAVSRTAGGVELRTLPAARPVVARPKTPLRVLPGERARIYISSPLCVEIAVGEDATVLRELTTWRLSDTWFGATTRDGELAYALRTSARTQLEEMPRAHFRLMTPAVIENRAADALRVERLSLPVPFLSIYADKSCDAWSEEVHLVRTEHGEMAELDVHGGPPAEAAGGARLSAPREVARKGHLFRAFGSLLGLD